MKILFNKLVSSSLRKSTLNKTEQIEDLTKRAAMVGCIWLYKIVSIYWLGVCVSLMLYLHDLFPYLYLFHSLRVLLTR